MAKNIFPLLIIIAIVFVLAVGVYFLFSETPNQEKKNTDNENPGYTIGDKEKNMTAIIKTNLGEIELELFSGKAPNTVNNFVKLAQDGFYDKTKFHRVIEGFMIQGGDPLTKNDSDISRWGTGGPDYKFADEIYSDNNNAVGTISMANAGPNTNGSQFFINTADNNFLNGKHTVFGQVISGMEVVRAIEITSTEGPDRPITPIIVETINIY